MSDNGQTANTNGEPLNQRNGSQEGENNTQNEQGGFFSSFFYRIIFIFIAMRLFGSLFKGNAINNNNSIILKNLMSEYREFDIEFYVSNRSDLNRLAFTRGELAPIFEYKNLNYSAIDINTTDYSQEIEIKWDIGKYKDLLLDFDVSLFETNSSKINSTDFIEKRNKIEKLYNKQVLNKLKMEEIYLYSFIRLKNLKNKKILNGFRNIEMLTSKINLFKYSDSLKSDIQQQSMLEDFEMGAAEEKVAELSNNNNDNKNKEGNFASKKFLKNLYFKPEISFYVSKFEDKEDIVNFQEYKFMNIYPAIDYDSFTFFPNSFLTDFWTMNSDLKLITVDYDDNNNTKNTTASSDAVETIENSYNTNKKLFANLKIKISFNFLSTFYLRYMKALEMNSEMMEKTFQMPASKDMFVELLKNNSVSYLVILFVVNILHSIFSYMGFASDVSYYKNLKELDGVYTKYILFSLFRLLVTLIYVCLEDAHFLVKIELLIAFAIELWKLRKIFSIVFSFQFPFVSLEYKIKFAKEDLKSHESEAISLMTKYLFMPISVLYLSYRIYYYKNTIYSSYFRFAIQYLFFLFNLFGFVLMTPQIYINYKLKSVEHMPIKALTYKFLNTIIDDLYAFAVKTTSLYRLSCFKDDIIFVIFIVQMIIYRKNLRKEENQLANNNNDNNNDNNDNNNNNNINSTEISEKEVNNILQPGKPEAEKEISNADINNKQD